MSDVSDYFSSPWIPVRPQPFWKGMSCMLYKCPACGELFRVHNRDTIPNICPFCGQKFKEG